MRKITIDTAIRYVNNLAPREKIMMLALIVVVVLLADNFFFVRPLWDLYAKNQPDLKATRAERNQLREDVRNRNLIAQNWASTKNQLTEKEKRFVSTQEIPNMLEGISKSAQSSGIRITSIVPQDAMQGDTDPYSRFILKMDAVAGTHQFGKFLAELEGGAVFYKVIDMQIANLPADDHHHQIEVLLEGFRKGT